MNTPEIMSKVTITLSLINSNKNFDFVGGVNAPINVKPLGGRPGIGGAFELS